MKVLQLVPADSSTRAARQAALDAEELRNLVDVRCRWYEGERLDDGSGASPQPLRSAAGRAGADLVHVYGRLDDPLILARLPIPWLGEPQTPRWSLPWNRVPQPAAVTNDYIRFPESVSRDYLEQSPPAAPEWMIGSVAGEERTAMVDRTLERIGRFRDDIAWTEFSEIPSAAELIRVGLWVDPGTDDNGGSLEALACGLPLVASRTPLNLARSAEGEAALLVPADDPNELSHTVLNALFRPEKIEQRVTQARSTRSRFDPASRAAALLALYRSVAG